jgi:hypothetical protein
MLPDELIYTCLSHIQDRAFKVQVFASHGMIEIYPDGIIIVFQDSAGMLATLIIGDADLRVDDENSYRENHLQAAFFLKKVLT